jgi:ATP-dependent helicase/nuclease subunit A
VKNQELRAAQLFTFDSRASADFGTAVHTLLAEVEWLEPHAAKEKSVQWRAGNMPAPVMAEAIACLTAPSLIDVWTRRPGADVWRERSFEVVLDGAWMTGVFDRVVVEKEAGGRSAAAIRATVYDFKTDHVNAGEDLNSAAARHAPQLIIYRRVVALLTGLPVADVTCAVIFTRIQKIAVVRL